MKNGTLLLMLFATVLVGCGGQRTTDLTAGTGQVQDANGQPMADVVVNFMPDVRVGNSGPTSTAQTGEDGRFTLRTVDGKQEGVVPGKHRVTLFDLTANRGSQDDPSPEPSRIPAALQTENSALEIEVKAGEEIIVQLPQPE